MTKKELQEIRDKLLNPLTIILYKADNPEVIDQAGKMVAFINELEPDE